MKELDAKLFEGLIPERIKPGINTNVPDIQIGIIAGITRTEHMIVFKTWMKNIEIKEEKGIFQAFDMEKFFGKEGLKDTLHTMYTETTECGFNLTIKHKYSS